MIIDLPYKNDIFMKIILPNRGEKLSNIEIDLNFFDDLKYKNQEKIDLFLPKFKFEYQTEVKSS